MKLRKIKPMNRRGDFQSYIYTIVFLFAAGLVILLFNHLFSNIYGEVNDNLKQNAQFNNTEAQLTINQIYETETGQIWDYAFLGIAIGYIIALGFTAFLSRLSPIFFWIYVILGIIGLVLAVMLSNTWQEIAQNDVLSPTIVDRFPITNTILGTMYPTFVLGLLIITLILMFGKFPGEQQ